MVTLDRSRACAGLSTALLHWQSWPFLRLIARLPHPSFLPPPSPASASIFVAIEVESQASRSLSTSPSHDMINLCKFAVFACSTSLSCFHQVVM
jgi:hypothetical protein